jgi:hypothetical protein
MAKTKTTKPFFVRCSSLPKIMSGNATANEEIKRLIDESQGIYRPKFTNKYIEFGIDNELNSIDLCSSIYDQKYVRYNDGQLYNDIIKGTPDIVHEDCVIDIKTAIDKDTWTRNKSKQKKYYYQLLGYMALTGKKKAMVYYTCLATSECHIEYFEYSQTDYDDLVITINKLIQHNTIHIMSNTTELMFELVTEKGDKNIWDTPIPGFNGVKSLAKGTLIVQAINGSTTYKAYQRCFALSVKKDKNTFEKYPVQTKFQGVTFKTINFEQKFQKPTDEQISNAKNLGVEVPKVPAVDEKTKENQYKLAVSFTKPNGQEIIIKDDFFLLSSIKNNPLFAFVSKLSAIDNIKDFRLTLECGFSRDYNTATYLVTVIDKDNQTSIVKKQFTICDINPKYPTLTPDTINYVYEKLGTDEETTSVVAKAKIDKKSGKAIIAEDAMNVLFAEYAKKTIDKLYFKYPYIRELKKYDTYVEEADPLDAYVTNLPEKEVDTSVPSEVLPKIPEVTMVGDTVMPF